MPQSYTPEFRKKIVRLHEEEGRTYKSITAEYGVSKATISKWCKEFSQECQEKAITNPESPNEMELMKENLRLRKELEEAKKENLFLKKQRHSLRRKSIRGLSIYRTISYRIWSTMAVAAPGNLPQCLLQLSKKEEGSLLC